MSESVESVADKPYTTEITIPFETERHASIVTESLLVDWRHESAKFSKGTVKNIKAEGSQMVITLQSESAKHLRVNINSILEFVLLLIQTVDNFDISLESLTSAEPEAISEPTKASPTLAEQDENGNVSVST